jgi:hypothetical protein
MDTVNEVLPEMSRRQPASFFQEAILDASGRLAPTSRVWGYHPLVVSLPNTAE